MFQLFPGGAQNRYKLGAWVGIIPLKLLQQINTSVVSWGRNQPVNLCREFETSTPPCYCKFDSGNMGRNHTGNNYKFFQVVCFESSNRWVRRQTSFIVLRKDSLGKPEKKFYRAHCQSWPKKNPCLFETDESDVAVAAFEFLIVVLDYGGKEDIDIM